MRLRVIKETGAQPMRLQISIVSEEENGRRESDHEHVAPEDQRKNEKDERDWIDRGQLSITNAGE
jgi:hypothetical protein